MSGSDSPPGFQSPTSVGSPPASSFDHDVSLSPPQLVQVSSATAIMASPDSPQLSQRGSSGRLVGGMKKLLRRPHGPTTTPASHTAAEYPLVPADHPNRALFARVLRPMRIRTFRRTKRRTDKQYHSDDGYTSDPGIIREEDDDETDGDPDSAEVRKMQQIRDLERKIEKARRLLHEEAEAYQDSQNEYLQGLESTMNDKAQQRLKSRFHRNHLKSKASVEQQRKKIEKLESQLRDLREGVEPHGKGLRVMSLSGLKGKLSNAGSRLRRKRFTINSAPHDVEEVMDEDDDDSIEEDVMVQGSDEVLCGEGSQIITNDPELSLTSLKEQQESSDDNIVDHEKFKQEIVDQRAHISQLMEQITMLFEKLEQEKERAERLEGQVNDVTELHQHEVGELRTQLAQMETLTIGKSQDLEDAVEECQSKVDRLNEFVNQQLLDKERPTDSVVRGPLAGALSFALVIAAFIFKVASILKTVPGLIGLLVLVLAFVCYWLYQ